MKQKTTYPRKRGERFIRGAVAILPLNIAVIPWAVLAGSYAVDAGLTAWQAQMMSLTVFAGSAQLVATGMFKAGVSLATMLLTTFIISSRHFLYSISLREKISPLPTRWRLFLGFLLTDELFAVCSSQSTQSFDRWYAAGAGGSFYLVWNAASFIGIVAGGQFPALNEVGLDFAVAATFIALVIPQIKSLPILTSVLTALLTSVLFSLLEIEGVLIMASLCAMLAGYIHETILTREKTAKPKIKGEQA
jgi:4-azaleucine resistance transporter AzlC